MAVTENQLITRQDGRKRAFPVKGSTHIYQGTLVFVDADGYAESTTATGVNGFAGIAIHEVNNEGASGDAYVEVWTEGGFELVGAGTYTQADVGSPIYGDDNYTISLAIGASSVPIGKSVGFVSATKLLVSIKPNNVGALPVAALTDITHTAPGTPDYAIQDLTNSSGYGFVTKDEGNTVLSVIKNLQARVADLEARSR